MSPSKSHLLSEQLRAAIRDSGRSMLSIARDVETDKATMSRFLAGERGLRLSTIDKIGTLLGLRLVRSSSRKDGKQ